MPEYCELVTEAACPACGAQTPLPAGVVRFQWGEVPRRYRPGDPVRWLEHLSEIVEPFTVVLRRGRLGLARTAHYNFGDPACRNLLAFDTDVNEPEFRCGRCGVRLAAAAARIEDGVVAGARLFTAEELDAAFGSPQIPADIVVLGEDGALVPRPEWNDPPLRSQTADL